MFESDTHRICVIKSAGGSGQCLKLPRHALHGVAGAFEDAADIVWRNFPDGTFSARHVRAMPVVLVPVHGCIPGKPNQLTAKKTDLLVNGHAQQVPVGTCFTGKLSHCRFKSRQIFFNSFTLCP